jgi:glutamate--cysteine ligase
MYRTCGTQLNIDYNSEEDFIKKFKVVNAIVPISIALFANSSIVEKKKVNYLSYRSKVWQSTSRGGLPKIFLKI